jgi:hypothetical protein
LGFSIMVVTLPNMAYHLVEMSDYLLELIRALVTPNG